MSSIHDEIYTNGVMELNTDHGEPLRELDAELAQAAFESAVELHGAHSQPVAGVETVIESLLNNPRFAHELGLYTDRYFEARLKALEQADGNDGILDCPELQTCNHSFITCASESGVSSDHLQDFLNHYHKEVITLCNDTHLKEQIYQRRQS